MKKLLIICGPTATGKTTLGLKLAKIFRGEIVSADSRQVYKGMDIGTGKDLPENSKYKNSSIKWKGNSIGYHKIDRIKIWGYDLVKPNEKFSVSLFTSFSRVAINNILDREKLPIIVGGTGLYIKAIAEKIDTLNIPRDEKLRIRFEKKSVTYLQQALFKLNKQRFNKMNRSDRNNPRRLIRAIEISNYKKQDKHKQKNASNTKHSFNSYLWIGLQTDIKLLRDRINKRVLKRVERGSEKEVRNLLKLGYNFNLPSMSAMGYSHWKPYLEKKIGKKEMIDRWQQDEWSYAKRQMTWFKKNKNIHWFDISKKNYINKVVDQVDLWYSDS